MTISRDDPGNPVALATIRSHVRSIFGPLLTADHVAAGDTLFVPFLWGEKTRNTLPDFRLYLLIEN